MTSRINKNNPANQYPTIKSIRDNFVAAATDIEELQDNKILVSNWNNKPDPILYPGRLLFCEDIGVSGSFLRSNGFRWILVNRTTLVNDTINYTLSNTETSEQLATLYTIPGNLMGSTGRLIIEPIASFANTSTMTKSLTVRLAKASEDIFGPNSKVLTIRSNTNMTLVAPYCTICNVSETSQLIPFTNISSFISSSTQLLNSSNIDTREDINIGFSFTFSSLTGNESGSLRHVSINLEP